MEFKKEYIHCVPDESLIGKRVLCGDTYKEIIEQIESNDWISCREALVKINKNKAFCPFGTNSTGNIEDRVRYYPFVYYDPEWDKKDEEITYYCYLDRDMDPIQFMFDSEKPSSHIYAEFTDVHEATDWCYSHDKFAEKAKTWEDGKTIQYYDSSEREWQNTDIPCWDLTTKYRIKPEPVKVETSEGKMYLANGAEIPKKRRMTNREFAKWLIQGNGQWRSADANVISMTYSYGMYEDAEEVLDGIMIRGWNETGWHEPEIEVSV